MKKGYRYLVAFVACAVIFVIWVIFQMCVARGVLVGVLFCGAMAGTWKAIVSGSIFAKKGEDSEVKSKPDEATVKDAASEEISEEIEDQVAVLPESEVIAEEISEEPVVYDELVETLRNITRSDCDGDVLKRVYYYQSTLLLVGSDKSKDRVVDSTMSHNEPGITDQIAGDIYEFVLKEYARRTFGNDDDHLMKMLNGSFGNVENICTGDVINGAYGPYGVSASNPIPVKGVPFSKSYLSHLRTLNGGNLSFERVCSLKSPVVDTPVDLYHLFDENKNKVGEVYLSAYQAITSTTPPEGFLYMK
jgi:hypothetical protein